MAILNSYVSHYRTSHAATFDYRWGADLLIQTVRSRRCPYGCYSCGATNQGSPPHFPILLPELSENTCLYTCISRHFHIDNQTCGRFVFEIRPVHWICCGVVNYSKLACNSANNHRCLFACRDWIRTIVAYPRIQISIWWKNMLTIEMYLHIIDDVTYADFSLIGFMLFTSSKMAGMPKKSYVSMG